MKKFYVSKSDKNKVSFIKKSISEIKPDYVYILCEEHRKNIFDNINAIILPLKELNKNSNWITFVNTFTKNSLLIIDNVLKFIFFGDGKKKYLKDISQSINNIIVTDVVPFYTEPYEIFYPFWFLGKEILGYNSYNTFKSNYLEEQNDGTINTAHSFEIIKEKISEYYIQDYEYFFKNREVITWQMNDNDIKEYENTKQLQVEDFKNPIKLYNTCSEKINLIETKFNIINDITKNLNGNVAIAINCLVIYPKMFLKYMENKNVSFISIHSNPSLYTKFDTIILAEMPIVKPHDWIYIESELNDNQKVIQLNLTNNKLESYFYNKIFNNELRNKFTYFYSTNM